MATLLMPDYIYNWIVKLFADRSHTTRHNGIMSSTAAISASVIQGSALGPASYIVNAADMKPPCKQTHFF